MEEGEHVNLFQLEAVIQQISPIRYSPAGVPIIECILVHHSKQTESGAIRLVQLEMKAIAIGHLVEKMQTLVEGKKATFCGFITAKSQRYPTPVFHLNKINF